MATSLNSTTLSAAITKSDTAFRVASATNVAVGYILFCDKEAMKVLAIDGTYVQVNRGFDGTVAAAHLSGEVVWTNPSSAYFCDDPKGSSSASAEIYLPHINTRNGTIWYLMPSGAWQQVRSACPLANQRAVDPSTGYEYLLVDMDAAAEVGTWVCIDADGGGTALTATSKGRVGILVATCSASDTLNWALVVGKYAAARFSTDATTAAKLAGFAGCPTMFGFASDVGNVLIYGAVCTSAPSSATTTITDGAGTAYINNPWMDGVDENTTNFGGPLVS